MYHLIENGALRWPTIAQHGFEISRESQDLISKLLAKDKNQRLGKVNDIADVMAHPWFSSIDVDQLFKKQIKAPIIPTLKALDDTSNFDEKFQ